MRGMFFSMSHTLQRHNTENSKQILPEKELRSHSPNLHIHVSVSDLYILTIDLPIYSAAGKYVDQSWEYKNRSQTHKCENWGLRPRNSQKKNT
jgi:hypothetical protein